MRATNLKNIKIREEFNDCPGGDALVTYMINHGINQLWEVEDAKRDNWQNDPATLVLRQIKPLVSTTDGLAVGKMAVECLADELDWIMEGGQLFARLWWD